MKPFLCVTWWEKRRGKQTNKKHIYKAKDGLGNILRIVHSILGEIFPNLVSLKVCFLTLIQQWFSYYLIICISINRFFLLSWVSCLVTEAYLHCHFLLVYILYILKPFQFYNPLVASVYVSINPMYLYMHNNKLSSTKKNKCASLGPFCLLLFHGYGDLVILFFIRLQTLLQKVETNNEIN